MTWDTVKWPAGMGAMLTLLGTAAPVAAQAVPAAPPAAAPQPAPAAPPSDNAMVNLVRLLVEQGVITRDKGDALVKQAEGEAAKARLASAAPAGDLPAAAPGTIRVPYVPATVRAQIKDELKAEVLAQAKSEGWASPKLAAPEWIKNVTLYGDVRIRSQSNFYSATNSNQIPNFAAITAHGPLDLINDPIPFINARKDRTNQAKLRARLGAEVKLAYNLDLGFELATGDDNSPISTNASLAGGFAKRDIWLQKAFIRFAPTSWSKVWLGRFANPFTSTDLLFDQDLAFDGLAAEANIGHFISDDASLTLRAGAFPLDFGNPNFPDTVSDKRDVPQKYLFAAQLEGGAKIGRVSVKVAGAYYYFTKIQGKLSEACLLYAGAQDCSTDGTAAFFVTKGNTLSPIRQIAVDPNLPPGSIQAQPQLLGRPFNYRIVNLTLSAAMALNDKISASITGDYVRNIAFKRSDICRNGLLGQPLNNGGAGGNGNICDPNPAHRTKFVGGNQGYQIMASIGYPSPRQWPEWKVYGGYRYLESDAVLDSFTDSDFHLGGTNAKGFFVGGEVGLYKGMKFGAKWMSANEISGDPLAIDVLQVDLTAAF